MESSDKGKGMRELYGERFVELKNIALEEIRRSGDPIRAANAENAFDAALSKADVALIQGDTPFRVKEHLERIGVQVGTALAIVLLWDRLKDFMHRREQ